MTPPDDPPMACTLAGGAYQERLAWIARLNRDGLRAHRRHPAALELHYAPAVRDRARELVRRESECCAFLGFAVEESAHGVRVTITVPDRAHAMADLLLEPFLPGSGAGPDPRAERGRPDQP